DQAKGIEYLLQARDIAKNINYTEGIINSYNILGDLYYSAGSFSDAINCFIKSEKLLKKSGASIKLYSIYIKIGFTYSEMKDFDKFIEYGNFALEISKKLNKKDLIANANYNLALAYRSKFEYNKALKYNDNALKIYEEIENSWGLGRCYNAIGDLNEMSGNYEIAFEAYKKAEKIFEEYKSPADLSVIYFNLASMSKVFGNYDDALMYLEKSLKISLSVKSERMIKDCYLGLYGLYNLLKDFENVNKYYMLFHSYTDEIMTLNSSLAKIEIDYELSKKEMESNLKLQKERFKRYIYVAGFIFLLALMYFLTYGKLKRRKINELRLDKRRVRAELSSLESKINPHFFFNSLSSISTLININPENAKKMLQNISGLFRYALRTSKNPFVTLDEEVSIVKKYLELEKIRFGNRLEFELNIPEILYNIQIPPLLIQPLVENSIKHAISDNIHGGKVEITCEDTSHNTILITVKDNGTGVSTNGNGTGFGLNSIKERLELMFKKDYKFEINKKNGYEVKIQIPKIV
ncbi:MAG: tetratricopeptide repeat protein, partial [Candidatus Delongbacteria bacterium]|nr:tetratricopeptide repeat protein [Candidatus Delongbacteria bacterium]